MKVSLLIIKNHVAKTLLEILKTSIINIIEINKGEAMNEYLEKLNAIQCLLDTKTLEDYAAINHVPIIQKDSLMVIKMIIKTCKIKNILEIGTAIGYSAIQMASTNQDVKVDTIERDQQMYQEALKNIKDYGLEHKINVYYDDALMIDLNKLQSDYDLLFIDAAKAQSQKFFLRFLPQLKKDAIIITDNILFHGLVENSTQQRSKNVQKMVEKIADYNNFLTTLSTHQTYFLATGDGLAVTVRKDD